MQQIAAYAHSLPLRVKTAAEGTTEAIKGELVSSKREIQKRVAFLHRITNKRNPFVPQLYAVQSYNLSKKNCARFQLPSSLIAVTIPYAWRACQEGAQSVNGTASKHTTRSDPLQSILNVEKSPANSRGLPSLKNFFRGFHLFETIG